MTAESPREININVKSWAINLFILFLILGVVFWGYNTTSTQREKGEHAEAAICALADDLQLRINGGWQYLYAVRDGTREPIAGITKNDILTNIRNQKRTRDVLRAEVSCPAPNPSLGR